jgi:hypothetical protein
MADALAAEPMTEALAGAFENFEAAGRETREMIEATDRFRNHPEHRAQAYVSLAEARAMAYSFAIAPRLYDPTLHTHTSWHYTRSSLGQNCQDMRYGITLLDGDATYRLSGRLGELKLALFQVQSHVMGQPDAEEIGNYDLHDYAGGDGTFDLVISAEEQPGSWIRLNPGSLNFVIVRRILAAITDDPGEMRLERTGGPDPTTETDPNTVAERLNMAADLLRFFVREWCVALYDTYIKAAGGKNRFALIEGEELASDTLGSPSTTYGLSVYELEPDQALIVEWDPPDSAYWSFQIGDVWSNALDFANYQTHVGMKTAAIDNDGRVRAVVSHTDPGVPNWLDTRGRREGTVVMRNYRAKGETVAPTMEVVPLAKIRDALPEGTPTITVEERAEALRRQRADYLAAFGD